MNKRHLRAAEPLLRNCHELAIDAQEAAKEGADAVLEHRMTALAKVIASELATVRANLNPKSRKARK